MGLGAALIGVGTGLASTIYARHLDSKRKEPGYPVIPSLVDPSIWPAGTAAARRNPPASGQPNGLTWATAQQLTPYAPGLIVR